MIGMNEWPCMFLIVDENITTIEIEILIKLDFSLSISFGLFSNVKV